MSASEPPTETAPEPAETAGEKQTSREPLDAEGMERPQFLLDFPEDPELERLIAAFEAGNYAYVRRHADDVAAKAEDEKVRQAALELRRRIEPDPLATYLLLASALLLVFMVIWVYLGHRH